MLYTELAKIGFADMTTACVAQDIVNNARWAYTKSAFKKAEVTEHEKAQIMHWAGKAGIHFSVAAQYAHIALQEAR